MRTERTRAADRMMGPGVADWTTEARCRGTDADTFFVRSLPEARDALKMCNRCTVQQACLEYAIEEEIDLGVWGGLTERQRRAYARRLAS